MRRVLRCAWNGAAALSLLLCVAACVMWVRRHWLHDELELRRYIESPDFGVVQTFVCYSADGGVALRENRITDKRPIGGRGLWVHTPRTEIRRRTLDAASDDARAEAEGMPPCPHDRGWRRLEFRAGSVTTPNFPQAGVHWTDAAV